MKLLYEFLTCGPDAWPNVPVSEVIHIDDCAKAHLLALEKGPLPDGKHKRLLVTCGLFTWQQAAELLRKERPELDSRLPRPDVPPQPQFLAPLDPSFAEKVLGIQKWIPWEKVLLDGVDTVIAWEKSAAA